MFSKLIKFEDFDGNSVEETFYFAMNPAEIARFGLKYSPEGDLEGYFKKLMASEDGLSVMVLFEDLMSMSVGKRSEDNRRFVKNPEITSEFMDSGAFSTFFMEMLTDPKIMDEFFIGVVPASISDKLADNLKAAKDGKNTTPEKQYTHAELIAMSDEDFTKVVGTDPTKMPPEYLQAAFYRRSMGH